MRHSGKALNSFLAAFGMYSKIPVPMADFDKSSMGYTMCFFPLVGAVIGAVMYGAAYALSYFHVNPLFGAAIMTALPLWISGGIHMDGFMDTTDALASWGEKEKKLAILKDSHVGAFAVMGCALYLLLQYGAWTGIGMGKGLICICLGYVLSRTLSGLSVILFPKAKKEGSYAALFSLAAEREKKKVVVILLALTAALAAAMAALGGYLGLAIDGVMALAYAWYYHMSRKQFGGITGDLAGYFLQLAELLALCLAAAGG